MFLAKEDVGPQISCLTNVPFYRSLLNDLTNSSTEGTSVILFDQAPAVCLKIYLSNLTKLESQFQVFFSAESKTDRTNIFFSFTDPLHNQLLNSEKAFHVDYVSNEKDMNISFLICRDSVPQTNLSIAEKYQYLEPMSTAVDQFVIIVILCILSVLGVGGFLYRKLKKQMEDALDDRDEEYKAGKVYL